MFFPALRVVTLFLPAVSFAASDPAVLPPPPPPQLILPQGTGPYRSSLTISELTDSSRLDPFNATHTRRLMVSRFEPVPKSKCKYFSQVPYFPPVTAAVQNEILGSYDYPPIFQNFVLNVCPEEHGKAKKERFPIALFSPGLNTTRLYYSSLAQEIASHGFIVITIDHPYDVDVTEFPNGDVIYGGRVIKPVNANGSTESVEHALNVRAQDVSFVIDTLKLGHKEKVVMFGQSFGGAAAATSMLKDKRIRAGVNLDGIMFGPVINAPLGDRKNKQSFLLWGSTGHDTDTDQSWDTFFSTLKKSPHVDFAKEITIENSFHASYWDLNVLVDVAGIRGELSEVAKWLVAETGPGTRIWEILGRYLPSFFLQALGERREDELFKGPSKEFPEVEILRD